MPRAFPHRLALFSLRPCPADSERAKAIIAHPLNARFVSTLPDGKLALDVGSYIRGKSSETLAAIGRGIGVGADIIVDGSSISKIQCSFEIEWDTGVVMLHDRSRGCTTHAVGGDAMSFEHGRIRRIVVREELNTVIAMGRGEDFIQFELIWLQDLVTSTKKGKHVKLAAEEMIENPALAWTADVAPTEMPSHRETRLHTPGSFELKMRYAKINLLGSGQYGDVFRAVNVDTGKLMAVKILRRRQGVWEDAMRRYLKREIEVLSSMSHPNIVDYITTQGWLEGNVEIFMGLKEGTLNSLIEGNAITFGLVETVTRHILQALDFIAFRDVIHRDVKPENILYVTDSNGQYQFQLGDFGLCNHTFQAATCAGSPISMAPEIARGETQSCKADVWSLLVTILVTLDIRGFRQVCANILTPDERHRAVLDTASDKHVSSLKEMAMINPLRRASAAQMLVKLFNGEGLTTPRNQVPAFFVPGTVTDALQGARRIDPSARIRKPGKFGAHRGQRVPTRHVPR